MNNEVKKINTEYCDLFLDTTNNKISFDKEQLDTVTPEFTLTQNFIEFCVIDDDVQTIVKVAHGMRIDTFNPIANQDVIAKALAKLKKLTAILEKEQNKKPNGFYDVAKKIVLDDELTAKKIIAK